MTFSGPVVLIANPGADLYGSDRMILETVSALVDAGWRVVVTVPDEGPLAALIMERGGEVMKCRTPVVRKSALRPRGAISLLGDVLRSIRPSLRLLRLVDPDVVYVNTVTPPLWIWLARLLRKPCVCHVHEGEASAHRGVLIGLNASLLLTQGLIVNSEFSRSVLLKAIPRLRARSVVVYNAVPAPDVIAARESIVGPARLVYVGRLSARKGPDIAVAALAQLRSRGIEAELDLIGAVFRGYEAFENQLRAQVDDAGLTDIVRFRGFQPNVWPATAQADVVLVPSTLDEPFGNTAVEAVLSARPLVVSRVGGLPEAVAGFDSTILVAPGEATELADAVARVLADWNQYRTQAAVDSVAARQKFSAEAYSAGIRAVLEPLAAQRPRRFISRNHR